MHELPECEFLKLDVEGPRLNLIFSRPDQRNAINSKMGSEFAAVADSQEAPHQLVLKGDLDYLVFDYIAELTMSTLVQAKEKSPNFGYARDFVELTMKPLLHEIKSIGIKVVANAGGVNVAACAAALAKVAKEAGVDLKIGTVNCDNLAKTNGQQLLALPIKVPSDLLGS